MEFKSLKTFAVVAMLAGAVALNGCSYIQGLQGGAPTPTPAASPTPTPGVFDSLTAAHQQIERALSELRSRNRRGALEMLELASTSLAQAAAGASSVIRPAIEKASAALAAAKTMILNNDKKADDALAAVERSVSTLVDKASTLTDELKSQAVSPTPKR